MDEDEDSQDVKTAEEVDDEDDAIINPILKVSQVRLQNKDFE